ncbi:MAG: UDP-N-acetylmuramate dehydrogenase [Acidimicrobiia bacterium]
MDERAQQALAVLVERVGDRVAADVPIGPRTTYRVGGSAAVVVTAISSGDLAAVRDAVVSSGVPVLMVGKGSNLLVADAGFPGLVLVLGDPFEGARLRGTRALVGGAAALPVLARRTAAAGLTGFEWAVGVPGSAGGAVRMNAGGHGSDMAAVVARVRVLDTAGGEDGWMPATALDFGYRHSSITPTQVVIEAELALSDGDRARSEALVADIVRWRRANQPGGQNAGSVFTNPPGDSAGRLIHEAGLKGFRLGTAVVSEKHANFIIAEPGGRAEDVLSLMTEIGRRVLDAHGVQLEPETQLVGFDL